MCVVIVIERAPLGCSGRQGKSGGFRSDCWNCPSSGKAPTRGEGMRCWGLGMDSQFPGPMRERPGGGGLGAGVLRSTCHCHPATENTALPGPVGKEGEGGAGTRGQHSILEAVHPLGQAFSGRGPWRLGQYPGCALPWARGSPLCRPLESPSTGYSGVQLAFSLPRPGVGPRPTVWPKLTHQN